MNYACKHGPRLGRWSVSCGENEILQSGTAPGPNKEFASGQKARARREPRKAIKKPHDAHVIGGRGDKREVAKHDVAVVG
jgi:hypothetical protein